MITYFVRLFRTLTKSERIAFFSCAVLAIVAGSLALWSLLTVHTTLAPARGGEYTEGVIGQPSAINPMLIGSSSADRDLVNLLFADLATLTETYATSTGGRVWLLTLKEDMAWSDGKPITSDDVVFTVQTIQHPDAGSPLFSNWQGLTVERVSQLQIRFTLKAPYSYFPDALKELRIAPAHLFSDIPISNIRLSDYNLRPVSSGPYKFESFEKRKDGFITNYHLSANTDYPGTRALIESFNAAFFPTYQDALLAFNQKQIDGIGGITAAQAADVKINHSLLSVALPQYYALFFNQTMSAPLKDKTVREALALATDKAEFIEEVFSGHATTTAGPVTPALSDYSSSTYATDHYSAEEAKALLAKQGWKIGSDGVQTRTIGKTTQRLDFELTVPDLPFLTETAELIKQQWQQIGIKVAIKAVPADEIDSQVISGRNYQMLLFGNILRGSSDLFSFWHSSQRFQPGLNLAIYSNSTVDKNIELARSTFDNATRTAALAKIQDQIHADKPAIFLYSPYYLYAGPTNLGGFTQPLFTSSHDRLSSVNEWYLRTERVFKAATSTE